MEVREFDGRCLPWRHLTEFGELPVDWRVIPIGELQPFVTSGSRGWATYYSESGSTFLRITNLSRSCIYPSLDDLRYVSIPPSDSEGIRTALEVGDILISITADIGIVGLVTPAIELPAYVNQHIALVRIAEKQADVRYLAYFLAGAASQRRFKARTDAGAKAGMNLTAIRQVLVALPSTEAEQQAIAEALSDADALIESLSLLLAKKRQIKQGAMQELLTGKKRLPGFTGDWPRKLLGELYQFSGGLSASRDQLSRSGHRYLHYGDIHVGTKTFVLAFEGDAIPRLNIPLGKVPPTSLLSDGDVVFVDASEDDEGVSKHVVVVNPLGVPFIAGLHTIVAKQRRQEMSSTYLRYCFQTHAVKDQFKFYAVGTKVSGVSKKNIARIVLPVPAHSEQAAIGEALVAMDEQIAALEAKLSKACQLKQGMMQELLTGRICLVQPASNVIPLPAKPAAAAPPPAQSTHNKQINEAVIIGMLAQRFGSEQYPLPRKRRVKLMYLLHRHAEGKAEGYLKKAAGPYDPSTKYGGAEKIALKNGYVRALRNDTYEGFVAGDKIEQAQRYFEQWYGTAVLDWLERFHYHKTDELELLATVDMAMMDLAAAGEPADVARVKRIITGHPEWEAKLSRKLFSDDNIQRALVECQSLFDN